MRSKNSIKAKSSKRGEGKLGYTESNRLFSTQRRLSAVRFDEDETNGTARIQKKKKKKISYGYRWRSILNEDRSARLLKSFEHNGHIFRPGSKVVWDWFSENACFTSREGWKYFVIKFIYSTTRGTFFVLTTKSKYFYNSYSTNFSAIKDLRPYDYNPRTQKGTYKDIEMCIDDAMEFFIEFPDLNDYHGRTKAEYKLFTKYYNKAKGL